MASTRFRAAGRSGAAGRDSARQRRPGRRRPAGQARRAEPAAAGQGSRAAAAACFHPRPQHRADRPAQRLQAGRRPEPRNPAGAGAGDGGGRGTPARRRPDSAVPQRRPRRGHAHRPPPAGRRRHPEGQPRLDVPRPGRQRRRRRHGQHSRAWSGAATSRKASTPGSSPSRSCGNASSPARPSATTCCCKRRDAYLELLRAEGRRAVAVQVPRRVARGGPHHRQFRRRPARAGRRTPTGPRPTSRSARPNSLRRKTRS